MTREQAKALMPFFQAFIDGKTVQFHSVVGDWVDMDTECIYFDNILPEEIRIKPEPTYRPFKNAEECWQEMQEHQPFGWIKNNHTYAIHSISIVFTNAIEFCDGACIPYEDVFENYTFTDGTPFGIKENNEA